MLQVRRNSVLGLAIAMLVLAITIACAAQPPVPSASPTATGALLIFETRGGLCPDVVCGRTIVIERDGRVHQAVKLPAELGVMDPATLAALDEAIRATDFASVKSHPFTGACPTVVDGQEIVYEFDTPAGLERIASCEIDIDFNSPLFMAVYNALRPFLPVPTR